MMDQTAIMHQMERITAYMEIQNLMGRYSFWLTAGMHRECGELFAKATPGAWVEMQWGRYEGREGIEKIYPPDHNPDPEERRSMMHMHALTTPVIEIAGDCITAKAVWISPGHQTMPLGENGKPASFWSWIRYSAEFIREKGQWKIWHLSTNGIFMTHYNIPWTEDCSSMLPPLPELPEGKQPTAPRRTLPWEYSVDGIYSNDPAPPEPYENYEQSDMKL